MLMWPSADVDIEPCGSPTQHSTGGPAKEVPGSGSAAPFCSLDRAMWLVSRFLLTPRLWTGAEGFTLSRRYSLLAGCRCEHIELCL